MKLATVLTAMITALILLLWVHVALTDYPEGERSFGIDGVQR